MTQEGEAAVETFWIWWTVYLGFVLAVLAVSSVGSGVVPGLLVVLLVAFDLWRASPRFQRA